MADRAYDVDAFRPWLAPRGIQAVIPARTGRLDLQSCDPEAYPARHAVARRCGWLKGWRRVAARYDQHAPRCLGFLCLAGTWIWLKLNIHNTQHTVMRLLLGYNIVLTVSVIPDKDCLSLQDVRHLGAIVAVLTALRFIPFA